MYMLTNYEYMYVNRTDWSYGEIVCILYMYVNRTELVLYGENIKVLSQRKLTFYQ